MPTYTTVVEWKNTKGVYIEEYRRDKWADEALKYFVQNPTKNMWYCHSGRYIVFATQYDGYIEIFDTEIIRHCSTHKTG